MAEERLHLRRADEVVVRMYGQGFGDCFLLAFPRVRDTQEPDLADPVYVVIDSGVFFMTPGDRQRMRAVASSIREATGGTIDLLVATHEHHDHLCGFEYASDEWKQIGVRRIWLAWTEDEKHPATQQYDREKEALKLQADLALWAAKNYQEMDLVLKRELIQVEALVGFVGNDDGPEAEDAVSLLAGDGDAQALAVGDRTAAAKASARREIRPPKRLSKIPDRVLDDFAKEPGKRFNQAGPKTERDFCEPGQVRVVPETAVDAYVLGPPTSEGRLMQEYDIGEVYPEDATEEGTTAPAMTLAALRERLELAAASDRAERDSLGAALKRRLGAANGAKRDSAGAASGQRLRAAEGTEGFRDVGAPFPGTISLPVAAARQHPFFRTRYFEGRSEQKIDTDWLRSFGRLALQADRVINNTSLVLAFRLPDERILLFVGDAQVGNWLSWHEIQPKDWRRPDGGQVTYRPTAGELLARTHVYKVGHHGSHNATLKSHGLEMIPDGLIAFVPTSRVFPQQQNGWTIPLTTLTDALWRKSGGKVIFPHTHLDYDYTNTEFAEQVESTEAMFAPMQRDEETIEEAVPLWRQVRI
jgi:hypothetical protein